MFWGVLLRMLIGMRQVFMCMLCLLLKLGLHRSSAGLTIFRHISQMLNAHGTILTNARKFRLCL